MGQLEIQTFLQTQYVNLKRKNASYSIRSFAKKIGVSPGTLSLVILGKRKISVALAEKIVDNLGLSPDEKKIAMRDISKDSKTIFGSPHKNQSQYTQLAADQYFLLTEWENFAILNLARLNSFKSDSTWIAGRLGISEKKVKKSVKLLLRNGLLQETSDGCWVRTQEQLATTEDVPNSWLKKSHYDTLALAQQKLDELTVDERDFSWLTFPMNPECLDMVKEMIRAFQDHLVETVQSQKEPTEVYRMACQFFPLTKLDQSH